MERSDPRTTPAVLDRMAQELGDHEALATDERTFTFAQLRDDLFFGLSAHLNLQEFFLFFRGQITFVLRQ